MGLQGIGSNSGGIGWITKVPPLRVVLAGPSLAFFPLPDGGFALDLLVFFVAAPDPGAVGVRVIHWEGYLTRDVCGREVAEAEEAEEAKATKRGDSEGAAADKVESE
jgi:hypothetical protein